MSKKSGKIKVEENLDTEVVDDEIVESEIAVVPEVIESKIPKVPIVEVPKEEISGRKVRVKFLKDLDKKLYIAGTWISGKKGEEKNVTPFQAKALRKRGHVI